MFQPGDDQTIVVIAATPHRMTHAPAPQLMVSPAERAVLDRLVRAQTSERQLVQGAQIVISAAHGVANKRIAAELGVNLMTVLLWRRRFEAGRLAGLRTSPRPGRAPTCTLADGDLVIAMTLERIAPRQGAARSGPAVRPGPAARRGRQPA
ncbi:MAG: helix-turn-helix domain-containing protein [Chloroflexi bacterium]|nr:helix-turn-helix domain-containing protein [Chloroflexota bacterium]